MSHCTKLSSRFAESEVKISDSDSNSDLSKISDADSRLRLLSIKGMKFGFKNQWKLWYTARNLCFNKSFKRNCTISTGILNLRVWCKTWSYWTPGVGVGQKIRLRLQVLFEIRLRIHPKTPTPYDSDSGSDSATLLFRRILRNGQVFAYGSVSHEHHLSAIYFYKWACILNKDFSKITVQHYLIVVEMYDFLDFIKT